MKDPSIEQIRSFRLHSHHLDTEYCKADILELAGACGLQNTPPGAWETALHTRVPDLDAKEMEHLLYRDKLLLQAWSIRGAPVVFPLSESSVFLSALIPGEDEPWIYTRGITLALDLLQMTFGELLQMCAQVMPRLEGKLILGKPLLDQTIARWMLPLLPSRKRDLWNQPSMYGSPDKQTVGGSVVSFLLRPCAFRGLVVFGERRGTSPEFTSYRSWTGHDLKPEDESPKKLVRKYLHCYGPGTVDNFISWAGCSGKQGRRMWNLVSREMEPVIVLGRKAFILSDDRKGLFSPPSFPRELLLVGAHDAFLDQRDRMILQPDKSLHKHIWKTVANPGVVVYKGEAIGIWTNKKKGRGMEITLSLWKDCCERQRIHHLAEEYAAFRQQELVDIKLSRKV